MSLKIDKKKIVSLDFLKELDMTNEIDRELFILIKKLIIKEEEKKNVKKN